MQGDTEPVRAVERAAACNPNSLTVAVRDRSPPPGSFSRMRDGRGESDLEECLERYHRSLNGERVLCKESGVYCRRPRKEAAASLPGSPLLSLTPHRQFLLKVPHVCQETCSKRSRQFFSGFAYG